MLLVISEFIINLVHDMCMKMLSCKSVLLIFFKRCFLSVSIIPAYDIGQFVNLHVVYILFFGKNLTRLFKKYQLTGFLHIFL